MLEFRHRFQTSRHSDDRTMAIWPIYFTIENWNPQQFWDSYLRPSWDTRDVPYFKGKGLFYRPPLQPPSSFIDPDLVVSTTYLPTLKNGKIVQLTNVIAWLFQSKTNIFWHHFPYFGLRFSELLGMKTAQSIKNCILFRILEHSAPSVSGLSI